MNPGSQAADFLNTNNNFSFLFSLVKTRGSNRVFILHIFLKSGLPGLANFFCLLKDELI